MKIEIDSRPRADDKDSAAKCERAGGLQLATDKQALPCKDATLGSTSNNQKGFRFLAEEVLKDGSTAERSRAVQQAVCQGVWQAQHRFQQQQQQAQTQHAAVVRWENFFPHQQLQVLLVEDDDATRHVVSALLRNCSYEVKPASNGLLAWELLMDKNNRVDLVLTEVVMPCLSGIGLLARIMNHEAVKHIPVIMMSSHDSMNVVFKCLAKGAVDFLVKPVRKNELKNLWQHVWRKCHSSSGSRSGSGSHTQKTSRRNGVTNLNDSGSNGDSDKISSELNARGGSDNGSGTQSPWTKGALEVESCHPFNKLHSTGLRTSLGLQSVTKHEDASLVGPEHCEEKGEDAKVGVSTAAAVNAAHSNLVASTHKFPETAASIADAHLANHNDNASGFPRGITPRTADVVIEQDSNEEQEDMSEDEDDLLEKHVSNSPSFKEKLSDSSSPPPLNISNSLAYSSKFCEEEDRIREKGGRGGVIHSSPSAFSRYNSRGTFTPLIARINPANTHPVPAGFGSGMPAEEGDNTSSAVFTLQKESIAFPNSGSDDATARSFLETNMQVECPAQVYPPAKHGVLNKEDSSLPSVPGSFPASKQAGIPHAAYLGETPQVGEIGDAKICCVSYKQDEFTYSLTNSYSQYHHHHHHHHHHIQHHFYHAADSPQLIDQTVTDVRDGAPKCGSSNMANGLEENAGPSGSSNGSGSNGNGAMSVNRSATGSNNGSKAGKSAAVVLPNRESKDVSEPTEEENGLPDMTGLNENCSARREAALSKFRQKRKERCFEKKVLYQSRKRLAEQRPRVRGQFVKQVTFELTLGAPELS